MSARARDWIIAIGYVTLIFATLEVAGIPLTFLRSHGWLRITILVLFFTCALYGLRVLLRHHPRNRWRRLGFFSLLAVYYFLSQDMKYPEEQLHFFEYGLVGIFFLRALRHHALPPLWLWPNAWALASLAGWADELLQGMTPTRHYDLRDVGFNVIAAGLGLLVYSICKKTESH